MRLQDCASAPSEQGPLGVGLLIKTWKHTDPDPYGVRAVRVQGTAGALSVECFGTGVLMPLNSPAAPASPIFAANPGVREGMSFFVEFDFGSMVSRFQGNVNLGLLVLAGFHDFKNSSHRSNYFSREFFYSVANLQTGLPASGFLNPKTGNRRLDTSALLGFWRNTNSASLGIACVEISDRGEHLGIRAHGVGESGTVDWGEVAAPAYAKDCSSPDAMAFSATFSSQGIRCHLQANVKQGVLVIAYFTEFQDGSGRSNYFSREFYYKER
jgi:hypothetical protein